MEEDKDHERDDGGALDEAVEDGLQARVLLKQNEEDGHSLEEWHQFGANCLQLKQTHINFVQFIPEQVGKVFNLVFLCFSFMTMTNS